MIDIRITWDDLPDDAKELVELGIYTEEEALEEHMRSLNGYRYVLEWINVKDRLPNKDGEYLVCTKSNFGRFIKIVSYTSNYISMYGEDYLHGRAVWYSYDSEAGDYEVDNVTHWMYLPDFPKY